MNCPYCNTPLGSKETITAVLGNLMCNDCAPKKYSARKLVNLSEEVVPSDIGIAPSISYTISFVDKHKQRQTLHYDDLTMAEILGELKCRRIQFVTSIKSDNGRKQIVAPSALLSAVNKVLTEDLV